jgi:hypothetical protein
MVMARRLSDVKGGGSVGREAAMGLDEAPGPARREGETVRRGAPR